MGGRKMTAKAKGDILEDLVAMMHEVPGVLVEKRKKLPVLLSNKKRKREVDVLITSNVAGYPIRIALGCKNEAKALDTAAVDNFVGILTEVGIPVQQGILVSAKGYTRDALDAAKLRGIRTLILEGLSADRLGQEINAALQSIVFLLVTQTNLSMLPYVEERFANDDPRFVNAVLDIENEPSAPQLFSCLWKLWLSGAFPATIGEHLFTIKPKSTARWHVVGAVTVTGLIASVPGTFSHSIPTNAEAGEIEKIQVSAKFEEIKGSLELEPVGSEEALLDIVHKAPLAAVMRLPVPRIVTSVGYWPPSVEAVEKAKALFDAGTPVTFEDIESSNLADAWRFDKTPP
jgi:hypothetical protein